jgi:23S rRNA (cytidine2498-2'-O)-methyltransferase
MATWLWTCRHTFESTLCEELGRLGVQARPVLPGLVRADGLGPASEAELRRLDAVYALQVLPDAQEIAGESVKALAQGVAHACKDLQGDWRLHALVPGQLKGQPKPLLRHRADLIADAVRRRRKSTAVPDALGQVLLLEPTRAWVSASPVVKLPPNQGWPSPLPAGLADVADDFTAPASSYRKLEEALACMGVLPRPGDTAVDLGASPGGWTRVLRRHGAQVTAVDRAALAPHLMADAGVTLVQGDAFSWRPPQPVDWLVSDIIAFPERVPELLAAWCGPRLCRHFVVQMKFKGAPDWSAMAEARAVAERCGYVVRGKHFFNDKNEVTWVGAASA